MPYEYALVTPRQVNRAELTSAIESLGQEVSVSLMRDGQFAAITAANDVPICTLYASQLLRLQEVDGYGRIPEGMSFWSDLTLHSGSGEYQRNYVERLATQLEGALLALHASAPPPGSMYSPDEPSGSPAPSPAVWKPRVSQLRVKRRDLRDLSYAQADEVYDFATLPASCIHAEPEVLWDAAGNKSVPDRIALVTALLDRGANAGHRRRDGINVLHVLFERLQHEVAAQIPMVKRLVEGGADVNLRNAKFGRPLDALESNRALSDEAAEPLYDYLFSLDLDILTPSSKRLSTYQSIVRHGGFRVLLRERCEEYLAAKGLEHEIIGSCGASGWEILPRLRTVSYTELCLWIGKLRHATEPVRHSEIRFLAQQHQDAGFSCEIGLRAEADGAGDADDPVLESVTLSVSDRLGVFPEIAEIHSQTVLDRAFQRLVIMIDDVGNHVELIDHSERRMTWKTAETGRLTLQQEQDFVSVTLYFGGAR